MKTNYIEQLALAGVAATTMACAQPAMLRAPAVPAAETATADAADTTPKCPSPEDTLRSQFKISILRDAGRGITGVEGSELPDALEKLGKLTPAPGCTVQQIESFQGQKDDLTHRVEGLKNKDKDDDGFADFAKAFAHSVRVSQPRFTHTPKGPHPSPAKALPLASKTPATFDATLAQLRGKLSPDEAVARFGTCLMRAASTCGAHMVMIDPVTDKDKLDPKPFGFLKQINGEHGIRWFFTDKPNISYTVEHNPDLDAANAACFRATESCITKPGKFVTDSASGFTEFKEPILYPGEGEEDGES